MSLTRLEEAARRLPQQAEATFESLSNVYPKLEIADQSIIELCKLFEISVDSLPDLFKKHYEVQSEIVGKLARVLDIQTKKYPEIMTFVTGSIAKLEYIDGISDIDILPIEMRNQASRKAISTRRSRAENKKFKAYRHEFLKNLAKSGIRIKESNVDIGGIPLAEDGRFYSNDDLVGRLGDIDEPGWAINHRGSLIFECAYRKVDFVNAEKLRADVSETCDMPADFNDLEFSLSAAMQLSIVRLSGIIPKLRAVRRAARSFVQVEQQENAAADQKRQRLKKKENEILKALFGRVWNSIIHLITLHVLFWCARIKPDNYELDYWTAQQHVGKPPAEKLLIVLPRAIGRLKSYLKPGGNWHQEFGLTLESADAIDKILEKLYHEFGSGAVRTEEGGVTAMPMAQMYLSFLILSGRGRSDAIQLNRDMVRCIDKLNIKLFDSLENCEKISLLLTIARPTGVAELIRLFGREVFDRQLIKDL